MSDLHITNDTSPDSKYRALLDLIPYGENNAVSMKYLSRVLGVTTQSIRYIVQASRIDGNIIARSQSGYFIPTTYEELRHYYNYSMARIKSNSASLRAVIKLLKEESALEYDDTLLSE